MATGNRGGRPPKPTAIKEIEGNPGKRPLNDAEPQFPALTSTEPPPWLDELASEHWLYFADRLSTTKVMTEADVSLLAAASERWSLYRRSAALMRRRVRGRNRFGELVVPPEHSIAHTALQDYTALMREFGVGPASRSKVRAEKQEEKDRFAEMFG